MVDLYLRGGMVVDGWGSGPVRADVAVSGNSVTAVGVIGDVEAKSTVDCTGRLIMPGFVDTHSHADAAVFRSDVQLALLRQGITTIVAGQDGVSFAPGDPGYATTYFGALNGTHPYFKGGSVDDLLATYDGGSTPVNVAYLIPHGTVRASVMGHKTERPSEFELESMRCLISQGIDEGAVGLSSGMDYFPGAAGGPDELAELCKPITAAEAIYVSHIRGYEDQSPIGVAEVDEVMRRSGVRGHISHFHGPAELLLGAINQSTARGNDLTFDSYPYRRGFTLLSTILLPSEIQRHGVDVAIDLLIDPIDRKRHAREALPSVTRRLGEVNAWPDTITLSHVPARDFAWAEGCTLTEASARHGQEPLEFAFTLMAKTRLAASAIFAFPSVSTDDDVIALSQHDAHMTGSDGIYVGAHPHPRGWGTFARLLGHHTRDRGDWDWGSAALHLSAHPARRFRLGDRGVIRNGATADLVVVHPQQVKDNATYAEPRQVAAGIDDVFVAGRHVLAAGKLTGVMAGAGLRRS
jgi:N-acyl-D-amino-acid deacylase